MHYGGRFRPHSNIVVLAGTAIAGVTKRESCNSVCHSAWSEQSSPLQQLLQHRYAKNRMCARLLATTLANKQTRWSSIAHRSTKGAGFLRIVRCLLPPQFETRLESGHSTRWKQHRQECLCGGRRPIFHLLRYLRDNRFGDVSIRRYESYGTSGALVYEGGCNGVDPSRRLLDSVWRKTSESAGKSQQQGLL